MSSVRTPDETPVLGAISGAPLDDVACLLLPLWRDPFYRLRPSLDRQAMLMSLELAQTTYHLDLADWMRAGWTDFSIQVDDLLQSGVQSNESLSDERMRRYVNLWKLRRAKSALRESNPVQQILGALRQRERSDTIKAVTMIHQAGDGRYVIAIGFMGTGRRFYDWFSNFRFSTEEGFHKGFYQLTDYFEQSAERILFPETAEALGLERLTLGDALREMRSARSRFSLWMAGHSQGAAVMQVFCHKLLTDWGVQPQNMLGYGFASPTVATGSLVYDPARYPLYHIINADDYVPRAGALIHLGMGLSYEPDDAFRARIYREPDDEKERQAAGDLRALLAGVVDTPTFLEVGRAFFESVLEQKGEETLHALMERKWAIRAVDRMLEAAGNKTRMLAQALRRATRRGYADLMGRAMDEERFSLLRARADAVVGRYPLRLLLSALVGVLQPPHSIMLEHGTRPGSYCAIARGHADELRPFIWRNASGEAPMRSFGDAVVWRGHETEGAGLAVYAKRRAHTPRPHGTGVRSVRSKGFGARRKSKA